MTTIIANHMLEKFNIKTLDIDMGEQTSEEICFKINNPEKTKLVITSLKTEFEKYNHLHFTEMGGVLGILIEEN